MKYKQNSQLKSIELITGYNNPIKLESSIFYNAILRAHLTLDKFREFDVDVFEILGMRNLSAFIGEVYAASIVKESNGLLSKNPHQDGYPDMLFMDEIGLSDFRKIRSGDKAPFSPFKNGGIEVKATVGSVPSPFVLERKGLKKPELGDNRIDFLMGYDWKAHHRETNNLLGILWDFINGSPRIVAVFFSSQLTESDWGNIVQPKAGGGRTTSVSIMNRIGIKKMYDGCLFVIDDNRYINFLNRYNKSNQL